MRVRSRIGRAQNGLTRTSRRSRCSETVGNTNVINVFVATSRAANTSTTATGYDGGDCCECTCVDTADHTCGDHGFSCLDPDALCFDDDDDVTGLPTIDDCIPDYASDGDCDLGNNIEECGEWG